jgi:hypothetical protein
VDGNTDVEERISQWNLPSLRFTHNISHRVESKEESLCQVSGWSTPGSCKLVNAGEEASKLHLWV